MLCALLGVVGLPAVGLLTVRVPLSVLALDVLLGTMMVALPRLLLRAGGRWQLTRRGGERGSRRVLIAGAGAAGGMLLKQIQSHPSIGLEAVGFVDDDREKRNHKLYGVPVLGTLRDTARICRELAVDEVLIAMPAAAGTLVRELVRETAQAGVKTRTLPTFPDIITGRFDPFALREVQIEDLLRREPINTDMAQVRDWRPGRRCW